jgi:hypothetical protein
MQPSNFEELNSVGRDDGIGAIGEELEGGGPTSHRWPREETLALLRIRLEMDSAFRDASPKGPLWEEVSRYLIWCFYFFYFSGFLLFNLMCHYLSGCTRSIVPQFSPLSEDFASAGESHIQLCH